MLQGTLALVARSLRQDSRALHVALTRLFLLVVTLIGLWFTTTISAVVGAPGRNLFTSIVYINATFLTFVGCSFFSSVITEEKEEMTLGLLKMAGVNPLALLLGKSLPRLIVALLLLTVQFPFTLLAITLGGVTIAQVFAAYVTLVAYCCALTGLGSFFSVICRKTSSASWLCGILIFVFLVLPALLDGSAVSLVSNGDITRGGLVDSCLKGSSDWLWEASVWKRLMDILSTGFADSPFGFQAATNVVFGLVMFGLGWLLFEQFNANDAPVHTAPSRFSLRRKGILPPGRVVANALSWKDFHFIAGGWPFFIGKLILYPTLIFLMCCLQYLSESKWPSHEDVGVGIRMYMLGALCLEPAVYTSRLFHDELKWKTWATLNMLPLSVPRIAYAKILGCLFGLIPAVIVFQSSMLVNFNGYVTDMGNALQEWGWPVFAVNYLLFLHIAGLLSLFLRWGSVPIAMFGVLIGFYFIVGMAAMTIGFTGGSEIVFFSILSALQLAVVAILHYSTGRYLYALAGE